MVKNSAMATLTRKQREIRDREALILHIGRRMLVETGYLGLTMDKIAKATEYSKGTIYQHFSCKEEVMAAIAVDTARVRASLFERAARFKGSSRERMTAIGEANELFCLLYPHHFQAELIIRSASVRPKTSEKRQGLLTGCDQQCMSIVQGVVRDAIAAGDLPEETSPAILTAGLWTMSFGTHVLSSMDLDFQGLGIGDLLAALRGNAQRFLDGYGWTPLSSAWDYAASLARIRSEVFPEEHARAVASVP